MYDLYRGYVTSKVSFTSVSDRSHITLTCSKDESSITIESSNILALGSYSSNGPPSSAKPIDIISKKSTNITNNELVKISHI